MPSRAVVWFRRGLRVTDHPALLAALDAADQVGRGWAGAGGPGAGGPSPAELGTGPGELRLDLFRLDGELQVPPPDPVALERLRWFVDRRVDGCARSRNYLATDGTSRLSPYLRFGLVSPRQVAAAIGRGPMSPSTLGGPEGAWEHMRREFAHFGFEDDPEGLAAWREGRTGPEATPASRGGRRTLGPGSPRPRTPGRRRRGGRWRCG